ncbi:ATP-binding protein [Stenotrophomonas rhizophila]|uniref:ATP-binding protein n=1 Tax=Stenotrophomonas rhizophila TaxID=216778 RepID=UPI001E333979|nr:transporter substrate-binding domain-containing protein [Stenotrophomonas rhizophila]MCC7634817.1 transporter substrate-binding domain-containing protein [Stenotrophomonas rhizophila]MCC7664510.1 transporter substrate-binding domain-containing protein [Stenotrophomonas rhizophila]
MRTWLLCCLIVLGLAWPPGHVVAAPSVGAAASAPVLTAAQGQWLRAHPRITVGVYESGWPPFEELRDGRPDGLAWDYLRASTQRLGVALDTRVYPDWPSVLAAACRGEIDVVMNVSLTAERTRCLVFTDPYSEAPLALAARRTDPRPSDRPYLRGLRVVMEKGFVSTRSARDRYPSATHLLAPDTISALRMVADREADVYIGNPYVITALLKREGIDNVELVRQGDLPLETLHFAVPNARQPLAEALGVAMNQVPAARMAQIRTNWLPALQWRQGQQVVSLRMGEQQLQQRTLRVGFAPDWAPISFVDANGQPAGLAGEYLRRLRAVGLRLEIVPVRDWQEVRDKMASGKMDLVMGLPADRHVPADGWARSNPFLIVANVIVNRRGSATVLRAGDLDGQRVCVSDPVRLGPWLREESPTAIMVPVRSTREGVALLAAGGVDACIGNLAVVDKLLQERYPGQLQVAAPAGIDDVLVLGAAPRDAAAVAVFNRVLDNMSLREREALRGDWLAVQYRSGVDWKQVLTWLLPILGVLLIVAAVHGIGHLRLRREVAERRRVEQRLAGVTGNVPAVVYQLARAADGGLSFPFIAGDMLALFGISAELGMHNERDVLARIHPDDQSAVLAAADRAALDHAPFVVEFRAQSLQGWRWVRSCGKPHADVDGRQLWSGYWIDITEAHAQSQALVAAKATAERAAEAKAEFLATMSHEIRTPMSGVLGMLEVLAHTPLDTEQQRVLGIVEESADLLRQLLNDILDVSKMEAGAMHLEPTEVDLRHIIDNVQQLFSAQATDKGLQLGSQVQETVAPLHHADGLRLRQILFNLLSNALKFTDRGSVSIQLALVEQDPTHQVLCLAVQDSGIGIPLENQAGLFQPFAQAETSTSRRYGGTGLGLSICQRLVDLMGGQLRMHSAPGQGTRVELRLRLPYVLAEPAPVAVPAAGPGSAAAAIDWRGGRVLVVEDHPTNQGLMRWRLQQLGVEHDMVEEGRAALEAMDAQHYDLVITDCRMPGMDGYALTREIRRREQAGGRARLPVIALTASAMQADIERCHAAGMDDVLTKPVALAVLRALLLQHLHPAADAADAGAGHWPAPPAVAAPVAAAADPQLQALIQRFGSADVVRQLVQALRGSTVKDLTDLVAAEADGNQVAVQDLLHRVISGLAVVGAEPLIAQIRALMQAIDLHGVQANSAALAAVRSTTSAYLAQLPRYER